MSRRDTIIIALLINAGLLAILFMLAVNVDDDTAAPDAPSESKSQIAQNERVIQQPVSLNVEENENEVDTFLKELKSTNPNQVTFIDDDELDISEPKVVTVQTSKSTHVAESKPGNKVQYIEVTVKSGDALEKIARNNGTTIEAIKLANNLTSSKLSIGQVLKVPVKSKTAGEVAEAQKPVVVTLTPAPKVTDKKNSATTEPQYYTVKSGDSPWKIAKEFQIDVDQLQKLNGLDEGKSRSLKVGEKIRIR